jgi:hypothetical protein
MTERWWQLGQISRMTSWPMQWNQDRQLTLVTNINLTIASEDSLTG